VTKQRTATPGCYICDPDSFLSDEEPCMECFMDWLNTPEEVTA
jgi:hypothetical protein